MARTHVFIAMAGTARDVYDVLAELVSAEAKCRHKHPVKCQREIEHGYGCNCPDTGGDAPDFDVAFEGLEEAANRIAELIEKGELS